MLSLFLALARSPAAAIEPEPPVIEIVSDPLARWAGTRWRLDTQLGFPYPVVLYAEQNAELQVVSMDVHLVVRCDLEGPAVRGRAEALCELITDTGATEVAREVALGYVIEAKAAIPQDERAEALSLVADSVVARYS